MISTISKYMNTQLCYHKVIDFKSSMKIVLFPYQIHVRCLWEDRGYVQSIDRCNMVNLYTDIIAVNKNYWTVYQLFGCNWITNSYHTCTTLHSNIVVVVVNTGQALCSDTSFMLPQPTCIICILHQLVCVVLRQHQKLGHF